MDGWKHKAFGGREVSSSPAGACEQDAVQSVPAQSLVIGDSLRLEGVNREHTRALAEFDGQLPPILVQRRTMRVIDGIHRLCAARLLGRETIDVRFFDGDEDEAFVVAVRANARHGLPLTLADRTAAAIHIVRTHAEWSDRRIAGLVGISPKTVGAVRLRLSEEIPQTAARSAGTAGHAVFRCANPGARRHSAPT
jgi:hypothetical protein